MSVHRAKALTGCRRTRALPTPPATRVKTELTRAFSPDKIPLKSSTGKTLTGKVKELQSNGNINRNINGLSVKTTLRASPVFQRNISRQKNTPSSQGKGVKSSRQESEKNTEISTISLRDNDLLRSPASKLKKVARVLPQPPKINAELQQLNSNEQDMISEDYSDPVQMETPKSSRDFCENFKTLENKAVKQPEFDEESSCVTVGVRVRPFNSREKSSGDSSPCIQMKKNEVTMMADNNSTKHSFTYDMCFWSVDSEHCEHASQDTVYKMLGQPLLNSAFQGYNTSLFAYGQTGSGKSYSIMGYQEAESGVIPRFCEELFLRVDLLSDQVYFTVEISFFEIYNEKIHDLLAPMIGKDNKKVQLKVREHPITGPFVQDLTTYVVTSYADIEAWLGVGNRSRATAATGMNDKSSRSHSVFTILMTQTQSEVFEGSETQMSKTSKINLIDLAGSERAGKVMNDQVVKTPEAVNLRLKEGGSINKSLHTLGKVISILSDGTENNNRKKVYIPYRDSILTWLLKDSLGGNSKTAMLATVSPSSEHYGETLSTLRYAQRARTIVNRAVVNEDPNAKIIRDLLAEIELLKQSYVDSATVEAGNAALNEVSLLKERLKDSQRQLAETNRQWQEKLSLSEKRKIEEFENLKKAGISFKVDNKLPNLVNLNEDPQLSEMLLYILKQGVSSVGHQRSTQNHDIQLSGALIAENHCVIKNEGETVTLTPSEEASTYLNGYLITEETTLHHADRVVIGGDHFFRFNHPMEVKKKHVENNKDGGNKDFEFARNELANIQNARLEAELEEARIQAQEEIMVEIQLAKETAKEELSKQRNFYETKLGEVQEAMEGISQEKSYYEKSHQSATDKIAQLQSHKMILEQEILSNRKRLQMEALAAKQALEETKLNQVRIISELEKEKKKIQEDVEKLKEAKKLREDKRAEFKAVFNSPVVIKESEEGDLGSRDLLRISLLLREANKISQSLNKHVIFSRDDLIVNDKVDVKMRLNNTKLGITTVWSLSKFEDKLVQMRELYQQGSDADSVCGDEDPFYDPNDKWEKDFRLETSTSTQTHSGSEDKRLLKKQTDNLISDLENSLESEGVHQSVLCGVSPRAKARATTVKKDKAESIFSKYRENNVIEPVADNNTGVLMQEHFTQNSTPSSGHTRPTSASRNMCQLLRKVPSVPSLCRDMIIYSISALDETPNPFQQSICDTILKNVQIVRAAARVFTNTYKQDIDTPELPLRECEQVRRHGFSATLAMHLMLEQSRMWGVLSEETGSQTLCKLSTKLLDATKRSAGHLAKLLLGSDGDIDTMMEESNEKLEESLLVLVKQVGRMATASKTQLLDKETHQDDTQVDGRLKCALLEGQNAFIVETLTECCQEMTVNLQHVRKLMVKRNKDDVECLVIGDIHNLCKRLVKLCNALQEMQENFKQCMNEDRVKEAYRKHLALSRIFSKDLVSLIKSSSSLASVAENCFNSGEYETLMEYSSSISSTNEKLLNTTQSLIDFLYPDLNGRSNEAVITAWEKVELISKDILVASADVRRTLRRYSFLSPHRTWGKYNQEMRRDECMLESSSCLENSFEKMDKDNMNALFRTDVSVLTNKEKLHARRQWTKESPI